MKRIAFVVFVIMYFACSTNPAGAQNSQEVQCLDDEIEVGLLLMFEKGLAQYYSNTTKEELRRLIYKPGGIYFYTTPHPNEPYYKLLFTLQGGGISRSVPNRFTIVTLQVFNYVQDIQNNVIEYWVVKKYDHTFRYNKCRFIITIADNLRSRRRIVIDTDEFIESAVAGGRTIQFPTDNVYVLQSLRAHDWPHSFTKTDLAYNKFAYDKNGELIIKKMGNWERRRFNRKNGLN